MNTIFNITANYKPMGDQPEAIENLYNGLKKNKNIKHLKASQVQEKRLLWPILLLDMANLL